jgi:predicted  nucleic acid-binding Zn-ribbon protein
MPENDINELVMKNEDVRQCAMEKRLALEKLRDWEKERDTVKYRLRYLEDGIAHIKDTIERLDEKGRKLTLMAEETALEGAGE